MVNTTFVSGQSLDIQAEKLDVLKNNFPEIFTEGKIDCLKLKQTLGESVSTDSERYGLSWAGKSNCFNDIQTPTMATLVPNRDESVDFDKTKNLFIEGENLEVLKVLQKSYHSKVKMIYIDPPYNTGTDSFVYPDNFSESEQEYLKKAGDVAETGELLRDFHKNSKDGGRYHSNWLNMIYPRLFLARNLLREDGVIFVSIDDNEAHNLRMVMNEVFGEENFIGSMIRKSKIGGGSDSKFIVKEHEYLIVFAKDAQGLPEMFTPHNIEYLKRYKEEDENGKYFWDTFSRPGLKNPINYDVKLPDGTFKNGDWIRSKDRFEDDLENEEIRFVKKEDGSWSVQFKQYLNEDGKKPRSFSSDLGSTIDGKKDIKRIFENSKIFSYPKPVKLIKFIVDIVTEPGDIVLDFFAGSGTTADAIMQLNSMNDGDRNFILVQIPEQTDIKSVAYKEGYKTISAICVERICRASNKIKKDLESKHIADVGFKVLKLEQSNFKIWRASSNDSATTLQAKLEDVVENVKSKANKESILLELLLKSGVEPTVEVEDKKDFYLVKEHQLAICLADKITEKIVADIVAEKPKTVLCLDTSFVGNDQLKTNIALQLKSEGVEFKVV